MNGIQAIRREDGLCAVMFSGDGFKCGTAAEVLSRFAKNGIDAKLVSLGDTGMTAVFTGKDADLAWKTANEIITEK